jgi:hypothetical protein
MEFSGTGESFAGLFSRFPLAKPFGICRWKTGDCRLLEAQMGEGAEATLTSLRPDIRMGASLMKRGIQAIAFDACGTLFDVHSVIAVCNRKFPGRGAEVSNLWRAKQLDYTWLRSL